MPNYVVSGAGASAYNGTYEYYAADVYKKVGAPTIQVVYNGDGIWFFINGAVEGYTAGDVNGTPPLTGWLVAGNGISPAPTLAESTPTPAPTVTAISPSTGTTAGGTSVTITGTNLTGASGVTIGGTAATGVTVVSSTSITATTPAKTAGTASVLVTTAGGTNSANTLFTYTTPTPTPSPTSNTIRIKRSSTTTATPTSLLEGELAANITDKKIWIGDSTEAPVLISDYNNAGGVTSVGLTVPTGLSVANSPVTTAASLDITLTAGYEIPTTASQTNWDSAYTQRLQWDGGSTNLVAATGRTSLGATTVGGNLLTLTNPSAITFLQVNANNTVSTLTAASFRSAIGAGTSSTSGTVTSIATTSPITGGTITGTGTIGINAASANTASYVVQRDASGNFSAGTITATLSGNASTATSATSATTATNLASGGAGQVPYNTGSGATAFLAAGTAGQILQSNATSAPTWTNRVNYTASSTAPLSPAVGDHWYDTDDAALLVYINDGNTSQWVEAGSPSVGAAAIQSNGRLTLESGVPVSSTDQTAKTIVYYTPYDGNILSLYNGTSWNAYSFAELSLALGTLTSGKNYDVFAYISGSTVTLELSTAWTSDTVRADAISLLNGVYIKTSNNTRRYLGTFRTTATTTTEDSLTKRFVWNINNQQERPIQKFEATASWTYQNVTYRYVNNNSANRLECVFGLPSFINLVSSLFYSAGTSLQGVRTAIGEDATTSASVNCNIVDGATVPNGYVGTTSYLCMKPATGYHFYAWLESTFTTVAVTFYSDASGYRRVGISGHVVN